MKIERRDKNSKVCTKCKVESDNFSPDKRSKDGLKSSCRICNNEQSRGYRKTKIGLANNIYDKQRRNSKHRNHKMPTYTKQELKDWLFAQKLFHELYNNWVESGYEKMLVPSVDRIDDYESYTMDNISIATWDENNKKHR